MTAIKVLDGTSVMSRPFTPRHDCAEVLFRISGRWSPGQELELQCKVHPAVDDDTWQVADIVWDRSPPHVLIPRLLRLSCDLKYRIRAETAGPVVHVLHAHAEQTSREVVKFLPTESPVEDDA